MLTHRGLLRNIQQIAARFGVTGETRSVSWLPPYHDMGLIGSLLTSVCAGAFCVQMSPAAFTQRPARWLEAISRYRATISGGPNSAYELCAARISPEGRGKLDLSSWEVAFNGAEAVRPATLERFEGAFAAHGFRRSAWMPCYGLAEATLMVASGKIDREPAIAKFRTDLLARNQMQEAPSGENATTLAGCGSAIDATCLRIVDPTSLSVCAPGCVGEIWVSGPSVAQGYWNRAEETKRTFGARLEDGLYLRTGDLGCLHDGELFVTGRLKDLIVMNGANHYPQEIEASASASHPAARAGCCAAFAVNGPGGEGLAIVQETEPRAEYKPAEVFAAMRKAVAEAHGIDTAAIALIAPGSIPRTSSGKIRRNACRAAFLEGALDAAAEWKAPDAPASGPAGRSEEEIREWLARSIAERLGVDANAVAANRAFADYGLESSDAVGLVIQLEEWLGRPVPPTVVWDFPSIELLARRLALGPEVHPETLPAPETLDRSQAIAVIGIGCRFPGAENPEAFWRLLSEGRSAIREAPPARWDLSPWRDAGKETAVTNAARWGGFLDGVDQFDPQFFGITPREARSMDPQQRLLMEVAWEALEDAGIPPSSIAGSRTGVFVGVSNPDYGRGRGGPLDYYSGTGNALSIAANRISYFLDLKGPSLAVDTACSSSLAGLHLACQSIQRGESAMALAGGVNLLLSPEASIVFAQANMLAPDGICKVFDAAADGYVRAEGCGVVVLKPVSEALRDGDSIAGVILATSVNQDGRTNGLTAPNGPSQRAAMQDALARAGVAPGQVSYVEAHGTGTPLGDPIEVQSLGALLGARGEHDIPCWVGSLKANVGHLEPSAGIASLIKTVLAFRHEEIPPQINVRNLNPHLALENTRLRIPLAPQRWPRGDLRRIAGVGSFGFGGTNVCAIVSEPPAPRSPETLPADSPCLFTLSARSESALRILAGQYAAKLLSTGYALADFCYSVNTGRDLFSQRFACVASSAPELADALTRFSRGESAGAHSQGAPELEELRDRYLQGRNIDWAPHYSGRRRIRVALPLYPFERERFWLETAGASPRKAPAEAGQDELQTRPLLGARMPMGLPVFEGRLSPDVLTYLLDHVLNGQAVLPAAAFLEIAAEAALEEIGGNSLEIEDVAFSRALFLSADRPRVLQVALWSQSGADGENAGCAFEIFSRSVDSVAQLDWVSHARGKIRPLESGHSGLLPSISLEGARTRCGTPVDVEAWYERSRQAGLEYGHGFRGMKEAWRGAGEAVGFVELPPALAAVAGDYAMHPAFLDACFHVLGTAAQESPGGGGLFLPVGMESFRLLGSSVTCGWVRASVSPGMSAGFAIGEIAVFDAEGNLVIEASGFKLQRLEERAKPVESRFDNSDLEVAWERRDRLAPARLPQGHWVILANENPHAVELSAALENAGSTCVVLPRAAADRMDGQSNPDGVIFMAGSRDQDAEALCGDALRLVRTLLRHQRIEKPRRLWLVTQGARVLNGDRPSGVSKPGMVQSSLWGLGGVIALEAPGLGCIRVDLDPAGDPVAALLLELACGDGENEIALRGNDRFASRLKARPAKRREHGGIPASESWTLTAPVPGDLETLRLAPAARATPGPREIEIQVVAAGLNFSDVMKAMGLYPGAGAQRAILGAECSGVVTRVGAAVEEFRPGDRVMAVAPHSFAPFVSTDASLAVQKPTSLQFEEAAAVPVAFLTAAYALESLARLRKGERVLIHAGTGGVGLAAIQIAQRAGAEIFATAGSPEKRGLLASMGLAGVFDSRSLEFAASIREITGGYGVDVVLNSLSGEALARSLELLAPHGRFLEIGKSGIYQNRRVGLGPFQRAISFFAIDLDRMFRERQAEIRTLLAAIGGSLADGSLKPLPVRVFPMTDASQAFRHMAQAKHIGKIVLSPPPRQAGVESGQLIRGDATYLVTGGTGALGLQVAGWLVRRGARHIALVSRNGAPHAASASLREWRDKGVEVRILTADVSRRDQMERVFSSLAEMPPLRGVVHAAGILSDATLLNLTPERFQAVWAPKAAGAWNLHELTLQSPLKFFILFSSLASITGSPGQGNYAAANAFLDTLAHYRRSVGLPAVSINWGPWAEGGMAARASAAGRRTPEGLRALPPDEALDRMEAALQPDPPAQVVIASADWPRLAGLSLAGSPLLSSLRTAAEQPPATEEAVKAPWNGASSKAELTRQALVRTAHGRQGYVLETHIREQISRVSGIPIDRIDAQQSLGKLGIDSLTSLELFTNLERTLQVNVPAVIMTADLNVATLAANLVEQLRVN
jgi:acyl transferase domain-containing protein/NADPH:quinone reductase-like Zn-dependent oxidoreductase/acyl carrier protein